MRVGEKQLAVLGPGALVRVRASTEKARALSVAAAPIGEPMQRGPFVMNSEAELDQAFADYRAGTLTAM